MLMVENDGEEEKSRRRTRRRRRRRLVRIKQKARRQRLAKELTHVRSAPATTLTLGEEHRDAPPEYR